MFEFQRRQLYDCTCTHSCGICHSAGTVLFNSRNKKGKKLGISKEKIKSTIVSSGLFTVAPAIGIVATVLTLSAGLGYVLPWIRLTVIGNISYEVTAATNAVEAYGLTGGIANEITDPTVFATVAWVMTLGSIMPLVLIPIFLKKIQGKIAKTTSKTANGHPL